MSVNTAAWLLWWFKDPIYEFLGELEHLALRKEGIRHIKSKIQR